MTRTDLSAEAVMMNAARELADLGFNWRPHNRDIDAWANEDESIYVWRDRTTGHLSIETGFMESKTALAALAQLIANAAEDGG